MKGGWLSETRPARDEAGQVAVAARDAVRAMRAPPPPDAAERFAQGVASAWALRQTKPADPPAPDLRRERLEKLRAALAEFPPEDREALGDLMDYPGGGEAAFGRFEQGVGGFHEAHAFGPGRQRRGRDVAFWAHVKKVWRANIGEPKCSTGSAFVAVCAKIANAEGLPEPLREPSPDLLRAL